MPENYTSKGMKAKESLFFNEILNTVNEISWNRISENFSLGFPITKEIPKPKNTRQKNPNTSLSSPKQIFALHQKEHSQKMMK